MLTPQKNERVPAKTAKLAKKIFPKGNRYLTLRDRLGSLYADERFAILYPSKRGRPAESPGFLALVTIIQHLENLSDAEVVEQIIARIDLKYLLALELEYTGFDASILSEYRTRVVEQGLEKELLEAILEKAHELKLLKERGRQRTDSTHVLGAVAQLNRLELVGETLRMALEAVAVAAPQWLRERVPPEWYERYGQRLVAGPQPRKSSERMAQAQQIAADGEQLLKWCQAQEAPDWLMKLPAMALLQCVWEQQYCHEDGQWRWRREEEMPAHTERIVSPHDPEMRYSCKRETEWGGYKVHFTETCDPDSPHLITNVETGNAAAPDSQMTTIIHQHLAENQRLPQDHLVDRGYLNSAELVAAQARYQVRLVGHVAQDHSWQAQAQQGYALAAFEIHWETQCVTCPQGHQSVAWTPTQAAHHPKRWRVRFAPRDCLACPAHDLCTHSSARILSFHTQSPNSALQARRHEQSSPAFHADYKPRSGIEGSLSQAVRSCGLRRSRYVGQAKTHLQNLAIAAALNLSRIARWLSQEPLSFTRRSHFAALIAA
ncbi:MAG: IS1182 family transposase [Anaerolineaceae bacterium]|nr:IS1182 family transposase [Anaerolineaceae bacterium]